MKIRMIAVAALGLASACGGGSTPSQGPGPENAADGGQGDLAGMGGISMGGGQPSVFSLLGERERMALSSQQVTALDSINREWAIRNDSLQSRLRGTWGSARSRTNQSFQQARPVLIQIAENNEIANRAVESLLTEDQRRTACAIQGEQRAEAAQRPGGRPDERRRTAPIRRGRGAPRLDTIPGTRAIRGWPWCAPGVPADSARRR